MTHSFKRTSHMEIAKLQLTCLSVFQIIIGASAMMSERIRMAARLQKLSKSPGRKYIFLTEKLWFKDFNSWYLATARLRSRGRVQQSAIIFCLLFLTKTILVDFGKKNLVKVLFFKYILVSSFIINDFACWYSHSYHLLNNVISSWEKSLSTDIFHHSFH